MLTRLVVDVDKVLVSLRAHLPTISEWTIQVRSIPLVPFHALAKVMIHDPHRSPCTLASELYNTDVLLTAHGFQVLPPSLHL
jgi:hypothetical protein